MQIEDTLPWYRQFWPWFIIALPATAVVAGVYTLWLSMQTTDSMVVRSDVGMNVVAEQHRAAESEAARLGLAARIDINSATGTVLVTMLSADAPDASPSLALEFIHPTLAQRDMSIALAPAIPDSNGNPVWAGHFIEQPTGRHYVALTADSGWRLSAEWPGAVSTIELTASSDGGR